MNFQESFADITSEQFKNGVCRLYIQEYSFTLETPENNILIRFPFNQLQGNLVYALSDRINAFFNSHPQLFGLSLISSAAGEETDAPEYSENPAALNQIQAEEAFEKDAPSSKRASEKAPVPPRKIYISQNENDDANQSQSEFFSHEWDGMFYYISFEYSPDVQSAAICLKLLEEIAEFLKDAGVSPDACVFCGKAEAEKGFIVEGTLCPAHEECASGRFGKRPVSRSILAYLTAAAFCAVAALAFIPLCRYNVMPSIAGIPMGLFAAIGFWLLDRELAPNRWLMLVIYVLLGGAANFCGDYLYLINSGANFDFVATFTYSLNIVNSIFDILCCVIIAHFSSIIIYDLLYKQLNIRKPDQKNARLEKQKDNR